MAAAEHLPIPTNYCIVVYSSVIIDTAIVIDLGLSINLAFTTHKAIPIYPARLVDSTVAYNPAIFHDFPTRINPAIASLTQVFFLLDKAT
jgi:hypothetical protein